MRIALLIVAIAGVVTLCISPADASGSPLPRDQWTESARLWLARAMVGEAGWDASQDHAAIAWVLAKRWRIARSNALNVSFAQLIRSYCAGLQRPRTARQRWIHGLGWHDRRPTAFPRQLAWVPEFAGRWKAVRYRVEAWGRGEVKDPCAGRASHWGGPMDQPNKSWVLLDCGRTRNHFYATN